jgi:2-aminoadipate transaminase
MIDHERFLSSAARNFQESAIRKAGALAATNPDLISFSAGYPAPDTFPWDQLQDVSRELLTSQDGTVLQYGATRGYRPLIEQVVQRLTSSGITTTPDRIVITTGSQQGLDLIGRVLLDPGDVVLVELPTYSGAIAAFHNLQAELVGVAQDAEGLSVDALADTIDRLAASGRRARFIYLTPNFQNPTGTLMSPQRRRQLLDAAARDDLLIVEDDPYGSIYFEDTTTPEHTRPLKADDADERVVYLGTISKTLVPGLRVAWLVAPAAIIQRVELAKQATDLCTGVFDQRLVHASLERGIVDALAPRLRVVYQRKRTVMEYALREQLRGRARWATPRGGFFLWVDFGEGVDDRSLFERAVAHGVSFVMGSAFFVDGGGHQFARLAFSAPSHDQIREGVRRLALASNLDAGQVR